MNKLKRIVWALGGVILLLVAVLVFVPSKKPIVAPTGGNIFKVPELSLQFEAPKDESLDYVFREENGRKTIRLSDATLSGMDPACGAASDPALGVLIETADKNELQSPGGPLPQNTKQLGTRYIYWLHPQGFCSVKPEVMEYVKSRDIFAFVKPMFETMQSMPDVKDQFGFLRGLEDRSGNTIIKFDEAEMLSGQLALEKAIADTGCSKSTAKNCVPSLENDFYIRNLSTTTVDLELGSGAKIYVLEGGSANARQISVRDFEKLFKDSDSVRKRPYNLTVQGNRIIFLSEQYTP